MDTNTMNTVPTGSGKKSMMLMWVVGIVILAVVALLFMNSSSSPESAIQNQNNQNPVTQNSADTSAAIANDLNAVNVGDVQEDFKSIDTDLNSL